MNTLVLNLQSLVVTEHSAAMTGLSEEYEATAAGVHKVNDAVADSAEASWSFGARLADKAQQQRAKYLYVFGRGIDDLEAVIETTAGDVYEYPLQMLHGEAARFVLGAGIRDNYLSVTMRRESASPMVIDLLEFNPLVAASRRL